MSTGKRVAVVEDDQLLCDSLALFLRVKGCEVETFGSAKEARDAGSFRRFDVVISDFLLPGENGIALLRRVREESETAITILITAYRGKELPEEASRSGVVAVLYKPFSKVELEDTLQRLIERKEAGNCPPS